MKSVIVFYFRHSRCCLAYVRSLASFETAPQCTDNASFLTLIISQDSVVTHLRCSGIFYDRFIANFLESVSVKEFSKSASIFGEATN